jgi:hypothetical protein
MSEKIKIRSVIICDDVRREMSGKEILIGVYNDGMIFPAIPAQLKQLVIRVGSDVLDNTAKKFTLTLKDPNGTPLGQFPGTFTPLTNPEDHTLFGFIFQGPTLYSGGIYTIELGIEEDPPFKISDFYVRLALNDEERTRLQNI